MTPAAVAATVARRGAASAGVVLLANYLPLLGAVTALSAAVLLGIALPAVWSAKPARRAAALAVLKEVLAIFSGLTWPAAGERQRGVSASDRDSQITVGSGTPRARRWKSTS